MSFILVMTVCNLQVEEGNAILAFLMEMTAQDPVHQVTEQV